MIRGGAELLAGVVQDPVFGPLVACGPGGVMAELIGDAQFRLAPLTDVDAIELVSSGKAGRLVAGYRGSPPPTPTPSRTSAAAARLATPSGDRRARPEPRDRPRTAASRSTRASACARRPPAARRPGRGDEHGAARCAAAWSSVEWLLHLARPATTPATSPRDRPRVMLVPLGWSVAALARRGATSASTPSRSSRWQARSLCGQYAAGAVIALMLAGGNALEARAEQTCAPGADDSSSSARRGSRTVGADGRVGGGARRGAGGRRRACVVRAGEVVPADGLLAGADAVARRVGAHRRAAAGPARARASASAAARPTPATPSSSGRSARRPRAPTRRSSGSSARPRRSGAVRPHGRPLRHLLPAGHGGRRRGSPGRSRAIPCGPSPCSSSRRRVR